MIRHQDSGYIYILWPNTFTFVMGLTMQRDLLAGKSLVFLPQCWKSEISGSSQIPGLVCNSWRRGVHLHVPVSVALNRESIDSSRKRPTCPACLRNEHNVQIGQGHAVPPTLPIQYWNPGHCLMLYKCDKKCRHGWVLYNVLCTLTIFRSPSTHHPNGCW